MLFFHIQCKYLRISYLNVVLMCFILFSLSMGCGHLYLHFIQKFCSSVMFVVPTFSIFPLCDIRTYTPYIGESASAMLNAVFPTSPWFLIMSKKWWEDLLSSFPNVTPVGISEDWESTRKSYVGKVVRAISSCGDINGGFIVLVIKIASVAADAGHQASWMMEQLHGMYCIIYCM